MSISRHTPCFSYTCLILYVSFIPLSNGTFVRDLSDFWITKHARIATLMLLFLLWQWSWCNPIPIITFYPVKALKFLSVNLNKAKCTHGIPAKCLSSSRNLLLITLSTCKHSSNPESNRNISSVYFHKYSTVKYTTFNHLILDSKKKSRGKKYYFQELFTANDLLVLKNEKILTLTGKQFFL